MSRANREAAMEATKRDSGLSTGAKYLLVYIGDLVGDGRKLEVGCDYLADEMGESRTTVQRWRAELVAAGYLIPDRVVKGGQRSNTYDLDLTSREPHNRPSTGGITAHSRAVDEERTAHQPPTNRPTTGAVTAHQPPTGGREQEQEVTETGSATDDADFEDWVSERTARRGGGPRLADKIRREDRAIYEAEKRGEVRIETSPPRNDPATCRHKALQDDGWCAGCSTQVKEVTA